jgi:hypothetical protein
MNRALALLLTCLILGSLASCAKYTQAAPPPPAAPGKIGSGGDAGNESLKPAPPHDPGTYCYTPYGWCQPAPGRPGPPVRARD